MRATYFAYMFGAIIGSTFAFSNTNSPLTWFHNSNRNKWKKILIINVWITFIGSILYTIDIHGLIFLEKFGVNSYYVKIFISFVFSFVANGAIPEYIFNRFDEKQNLAIAGLGATFFEFSPNSAPVRNPRR